MTENKLLELISRGESDRLDFKLKIAKKNKKKSDLMKDVMAFANTHSNEDAYIVMGVKEIHGEKKIIGLEDNDLFDDAELQQLVNGKLTSELKFKCDTIISSKSNKKFQVITISKSQNNKPFFIRDDFESIRKNTVYIRKNSSNFEINPKEIISLYSKEAYSPIEIEDYGFYFEREDKHWKNVDTEDGVFNIRLPLVNVSSRLIREVEVSWSSDYNSITAEILSLLNDNNIDGKVKFCEKGNFQMLDIEIPCLEIRELIAYEKKPVLIKSITPGHGSAKKIRISELFSVLFFARLELCLYLGGRNADKKINLNATLSFKDESGEKESINIDLDAAPTIMKQDQNKRLREVNFQFNQVN